MIALLGMIFQLIILIFGEYIKISKAAKEANAKFQLDQQGFQLIVQVAIQKLRADAPKDSAGASDGWDAADQDLPKSS